MGNTKKTPAAPTAIATGNEIDIKMVEEKIHGMQAMVETTIVNSDQTLGEVADKIKAVKNLGLFIKQEKEKFTKPAQEIINNARAKYLPYERECENAERLLKNKAGAYMDAVEAERKRKEESIAKQMETGHIKEETAIRKMEAIGETQKTVTTDSGAKLTRKVVKEVVIVDREKIPHEYWVVDEVKVRKVALAGVEIAGVEVRESRQMSI